MTSVDGFTMRPVQAGDRLGYVATLLALTNTGNVTEESFRELLAFWERNRETYHPRVIVDETGEVLAAGMLVVERKLIHGCACSANIEDIAVNKAHQGKKLGKRLIDGLTQLAKELGAYKVVLDCSEANVPFYKKCGYDEKGVCMVVKF